MFFSRLKVAFLFIFSLLCLPTLLFAARENEIINTGNTSFLLLSAALVMLMVPAVGLFYGGIVSSKNVLSTILQSFVILCLISIQWVVIGYSLVFGADHFHIIGGLEWLGLHNVPAISSYAPTVPSYAYIIFQGMFAAITAALIKGSVVERIRFPAVIIFTLLWALFVYDPLAHWVWGNGGFLQKMGALDFAGGTVVHISSGFSALAACIYIGKRRGFGSEILSPHNLTLTVIGAILLWFGWFGFNAGSALTAGQLSGYAFLNTNTAAASGTLAWMAIEWKIKGKPSALGILSGAIAGLVAITPAAGYVEAIPSIVIGAVAGIVCHLFLLIKTRFFHYDDSLDVFGLHGIGGIIGALLTGVFASKEINPQGANGLLYGNPKQLFIQLAAALICAAFAFIMTFILLKLVNIVCKLRAPLADEKQGLDLSHHGESGYNF